MKFYQKIFALHVLVIHVTANEECPGVISPLCLTKGQLSFTIPNKSCYFQCRFNGSEFQPGLSKVLRFGIHLQTWSNLFLTIQTSDHITSYNLPIIGKVHNFTSIEEEICPSLVAEDITFRLSSSSENVTIKMSLDHVDLELTDNTPLRVHVSAADTWVKLIKWGDGLDEILVTTDTVVGEHVCAVLVLMDATCPVSGGWKNLALEGIKYQTYTSKGALGTNRNEFPNGVFVVTYSLENDNLCTGIEGSHNITQRTKTVSIKFREAKTIKEAMVYLWLTGAIILIVCIALSIVVYSLMYNNFMRIMNLNGESFKDLLGGSSSLPPREPQETGNESTSDENYLASFDSAAQPVSLNEITLPEQPNEFELPVDATSVSEYSNPGLLVWWSEVDKFRSEHPSSLVSNVSFHRNVVLLGGILMEPLIEIIQSYTTNSNSQDFCLYNERCSLEAGSIKDFPRVASSGIYCLCAIVFAFLANRHQCYTTAIRRHYLKSNVKVGVMHNYSIIQAVSWSLFFQGIMSGFYHICPNSATIHFDMIFMYILSVLLIIGMYGLRHGNISQHSYALMGLVIVALFVAKWKDYVPSGLFWTVLSTFHILMTLSTAFMLTKLSIWSFNPLLLRQMWKGWSGVMRSVNIHGDVGLMKTLRLILGVGSNTILAVVAAQRNMNPYMYILTVCVLNVVMYVLHYIFCKFVVHKETSRTTIIALIFYICGISLWIAALIFYNLRSSAPTSTSAISNALNTPCILFGIFSFHDLWHVTSAFAMLFSFIGFLIMDDDLISSNISRIVVF